MKTHIHTAGVIGAGAMGSGIAQVFVLAGLRTFLYDASSKQAEAAQKKIAAQLDALVQKGKISADKAAHAVSLLHVAQTTSDLCDCELVIEAVVEDIRIKQELFADLESKVSHDAVLATNTSSLSVALLSSVLKHPSRFIGIHFFNPAQILPLVEVIPGINTDEKLPAVCCAWLQAWGKQPVIARDTPGFIVNRIARPYYSEAIRIFEEGIADMPTIDWAMKHFGGFKMGPFELMDFIGHDVNFRVTESVWTQTFFEPRYKPSITQKRLFEAGHFGRKTGRGFYHYAGEASLPSPVMDESKGQKIFFRILCMLMNEAVDACYLKIASATDIEVAMTRGVNYPKGLLQWANETGISAVVAEIDELFAAYHEERYRCSFLLRKMLAEGKNFDV